MAHAYPPHQSTKTAVLFHLIAYIGLHALAGELHPRRDTPTDKNLPCYIAAEIIVVL